MIHSCHCVVVSNSVARLSVSLSASISPLKATGCRIFTPSPSPLPCFTCYTAQEETSTVWAASETQGTGLFGNFNLSLLLHSSQKGLNFPLSGLQQKPFPPLFLPRHRKLLMFLWSDKIHWVFLFPWVYFSEVWRFELSGQFCCFSKWKLPWERRAHLFH